MRHRWIAGAALLAILAGPGSAAADDGPIAATVARLLEAEGIRVVDASASGGLAPGAQFVGQQPPTNPGPQRSKGARIGLRIAGAAIGAVGGAFAGGYLGAALEPDCNCDDPGFQGFVIGFPVGGVIGGVLGGLYLFR